MTKFNKVFAGLFAGIVLLSGAGMAHASTLTSAQVQAIVGLMQSFGADQSTINNVSVALGGSYYYGSSTLSPIQADPRVCPALSYNLYLGLYDAQTGGQVSMLQQFLGLNPTGYFGTLTRQTVSNFQQQYGVSPVTGGVGPLTRAAIARVCGSSPTPYPYPNSNTVSITGVSGPNSLPVGQQGTWTITTNAPSGSTISTSVNWGDQNAYLPYAANGQSSYTNQQNTFTHTYGYPGTYTILFTATDNYGHTNSASATIVVGGSNNCNTSSSYGNYYCNATPSITSLSPTQGVVGTQVTIYGSGFTSDNTVHFGSGGVMHLSSYNGSSLTFVVPSYVGPCSFVGDTSPIHCLVAAQQVTAGTYPVYVSNTAGQSSSINFVVTGTNQTGSIQFSSPSAGQVYTRGQDMPIVWNWNVSSANVPTNIALDLYTSSGTDLGTIAIPSTNAGSYTWTIPGFPQNYMCTQQYPNGLCGVNIPTGQYYLVATLQNYTGAAYGAQSSQSGVFTINQ